LAAGKNEFFASPIFSAVMTSDQHCLTYHADSGNSRYKIMYPRSRISPPVRGCRNVPVFKTDGDFASQIFLHDEVIYLDVVFYFGYVIYYFRERRNGPLTVARYDSGLTECIDCCIDGRYTTVQKWEKWRDAHREIPLTKNAAKLC